MLNTVTLPTTNSRIFAIIAATLLASAAIYLTILAYTSITVSSDNVTLDTLDQALSIDPNNPEYLEKVAQLSHTKLRQFPVQSTDAVEANKSALNFYMRAVNAVPSWPYYWAGVIQAKHALWQYDEEMNQAIQNAARYGPWFDNNQNIILLAGLQGWSYLTLESQAAVTQILDNALQLQPGVVIKQSLDNGYSAYLLPIINKDEALKEVYKRELKSRKRTLKK